MGSFECGPKRATAHKCKFFTINHPYRLNGSFLISHPRGWWERNRVYPWPTFACSFFFLLIQWVNYAVGHEVAYALGMLNARVGIKMLQGGTQGADIAFAASSPCSGTGALPSIAAQVNPQIETHIIHPLCYNTLHNEKICINLGLVKTLLQCA